MQGHCGLHVLESCEIKQKNSKLLDISWKQDNVVMLGEYEYLGHARWVKSEHYCVLRAPLSFDCLPLNLGR